MNGNEPRLALVPIAAGVEMAEQLLVYENAAAKVLKISIREFRRFVDSSVIPFRLHSGGKRRLFFIEDLRAYVKNLEPQHAEGSAACAAELSADLSLRSWTTAKGTGLMNADDTSRLNQEDSGYPSSGPDRSGEQHE